MANTLLSESLELIQAVRSLLKEESSIIATEEDCAFFRTTFSKPKEILQKFPPPTVSVVKKEKKPTEYAEITEKKEEFPPVQKVDFAEIRALLKKIAPEATVLDQIPDDREALLVAERWKMANHHMPLLVLYSDENPLQTKFFHNFAAAIGASLIEVRDIETCNYWPTLLASPELKRIFLCEMLLKRLPHLMIHYRENPISSERLLHKTPAFFLPDIALLLKNPLLKRSLWRQMCI